MEMHNTDIPRDRWGRPMILPTNGTRRIAYRRTTTFVSALEDQGGLIKWKARLVAAGMGQRKDLVLAAAATDPTDKRKLGQIADKAFEHANGMAGDAAETGTALHALTERIDRGDQLGVVPTEYQADIDAYRNATQHIEWLGIETFRVHDEWHVAGTADRLGRFPWSDRIRICDIKTGSIDYPHKMAMQLAMYARSIPYDIATDTRGTDPADIDLNTGVIIHLPAGQGQCTLYEIDIMKGWGACLIAKQVWNWRATKDLTRPLTPPNPPPTWQTLIRDARNLDDLRLIWSQAKECGQLTDELKAAAKARSQELAA
jgi:hypothetical protein